MSGRTEYLVQLILNGRKLKRVIIDPHYREKHSKAMSDDLILELVKTLDGRRFDPVSWQGEFEFFKIQPVLWKGKPYRLILTLCQSDDFLGVINAFRVEDV